MSKEKLVSKEGTVNVTVTSIGQPKEKQKKINIRPFVTNPASVSVKKGATIPTGNYASVRVDVMITMPCYVEEVPAMYKKVTAAVERMIEKEVETIKDGIDG